MACESFADDGVKLALLQLDLSVHELARRQALMSADEVDRACRFRFERDRRRFVAARGALRELLAAALKVAPRNVHFDYGPEGKPSLAADLARSGLRFNLSHSGDLALCALTHEREIGVDLEQVRRLPDLDALAERFFAAGERATLRSLPDDQRPDAFFRCWTRKEAYLKGRGEGLSLPLDSFEVSLAPGDPRLLRVDDRPADVDDWLLQDVSVPAGYAATLALGRRDSAL